MTRLHTTPQTKLPINPRHRPFVLLMVSLVLCVYGLMWGLPNLCDFAQDSVVDKGHLAAIGVAGEEVTTHRYPPFHFWVLRAAYLPARGLCAFESVRSNPKTVSALFILSARLVSVAMALGTVWLLYKTGKRLWGAGAGLAAALMFILSPVTLYYAKNANLDIPYIFWLSWALFLFVRILQEDRELDYLRLGVVSALAVCTKDQAYAFILLMPLPIILTWRRPHQPAQPSSASSSFSSSTDRGEVRTTNGQRKLGLMRLAWGLLGFVIPFVLIHNIIFDPSGFWEHVKTITGPGVVGWREFSPGPVGQLRLLTETVLRLMSAWTAAGLALVIVGLVIAFRKGPHRRLHLALLVPAISYYLSFPAVVGYAYTRFMLPIMLVLCLFAGRGITWLWTRRQSRSLAGKIAVMALLVWVALAGLSLDYVMSNYSRYDAQMWLETEVAPRIGTGLRVACIGDMRTMPRINKPIEPKYLDPPYEPSLTAARPDLLILSFQQGHAGTGSRCMRPASILQRYLGRWGLVGKRARTHRGSGFFQRLVAGELGYEELARFESPISAFVPEVAESVNRTIVILRKK